MHSLGSYRQCGKSQGNPSRLFVSVAVTNPQVTRVFMAHPFASFRELWAFWLTFGACRSAGGITSRNLKSGMTGRQHDT